MGSKLYKCIDGNKDKDKDKIKVLHYGLSENAGGIETYLYKIAKGIDHEKYSFSFIDSTETRPAFYDELLVLGCNFHKVTPRRKGALKNKREISDIFTEYNYDILHFHVNTLSYIEPVFCALRKNIPVVVHSRNAGSRGSFFTKIMHGFNKIRVKTLAGKVKRIAVSRLAGGWLFGSRADFDVYNNGVDVSSYRFSEESRREIRKEFCIGQDEVFLGCIAAFTPAKNQQFLIELMRLLKERKLLPGCKMLLVGDGDLRSFVKERADGLGVSDSILFSGRRNDIPEIMSALDLLLLPSFYEGFPNVVLEAQSCGLRSLISDHITEEVVVNSDYVRRLPIGEGEAENWLKWMVNSVGGGLSIDEREKAWEFVYESGFSAEQEIKRIEKLYCSLLHS